MESKVIKIPESCHDVKSSTEWETIHYFSDHFFFCFSIIQDLKATTIKEAIKNWEEANNESATEATYVGLQFQWPPIEKMDNNLSVLRKCE